MINGNKLIEKLLIYADSFLGLNSLDVIYFRNVLLNLFGLSSKSKEKITEKLKDEIRAMEVPDALIEEIMQYALENNISSNEIEADLFANYIFGLLTPKPSEINSMFMSLKEKLGSQTACDYLYNLSIKNYYIRSRRWGVWVF